MVTPRRSAPFRSRGIFPTRSSRFASFCRLAELSLGTFLFLLLKVLASGVPIVPRYAGVVQMVESKTIKESRRGLPAAPTCLCVEHGSQNGTHPAAGGTTGLSTLEASRAG